MLLAMGSIIGICLYVFLRKIDTKPTGNFVTYTVICKIISVIK